MPPCDADSETPVAISYSGGASSEWLVQGAIRGWLPRPRHLAVFFADTGAEHDWTYEAVERVERDCQQADITPGFDAASALPGKGRNARRSSSHLD